MVARDNAGVTECDSLGDVHTASCGMFALTIAQEQLHAEDVVQPGTEATATGGYTSCTVIARVHYVHQPLGRRNGKQPTGGTTPIYKECSQSPHGVPSHNAQRDYPAKPSQISPSLASVRVGKFIVVFVTWSHVLQ